jgi:glycosyltransferase involved in cell wall biosynthesis
VSAERLDTRPRLVHLATVDLSLRFLLRDQLRAFHEAGFDVVAMSAPGPWVADLERDGIRHVAVPALERRWAPLADVRAFVALLSALRRCRPTIVHTHTPKARILGRIAARLAGAPIVVNTFHGMYGMEGAPVRRRFYLWLERIAARWSDYEFSQSQEDLETLHRAGVARPSRSAYLGNGVDLQLFDPDRVDAAAARAQLGIRPGEVVVGTVGRLVWEKGYREYFAMAETLRRQAPGAVVVIVGPHEPRKGDAIPTPIVEDLARRGVVRFLGMRTDMPALYRAMDIFVLPSYREGFPRAAVEAAAMGLPLVLTDIRGCREVARDGANGFLVPPRDAGRLLAGVMRLIDDPALRARFGRESRRRALAEFDERRVIATTLGVYRQLLRAGHGLTVNAHQEG